MLLSVLKQADFTTHGLSGHKNRSRTAASWVVSQKTRR
jgi:hypothetical protein